VNSRPELSLRSQVGDPADETQGGVVHSHGEIVINRPPAEVFDVVADTSKEPEYNPRSLSSATHMPSTDLHRTLTFDPDPEGTRMRWSWDLEPDGALRGLARPRQTFGLDDMVRYGWTLLGETPNEEVVFGQIGRPWKPVGASAGIPAT
jgi:hypothetical protein